jgi:hypothetical protein
VDTAGGGASGEAILGFWHHKGEELTLASGTIFHEVQGEKDRISALDLVVRALRRGPGIDAPTVVVVESNFGGTWEMYRDGLRHLEGLQFHTIHVNVGIKWHALRIMKGMVGYGHIWTHRRIKGELRGQLEQELYSVKHCGSPHIKAPETTGKDMVSCIILCIYHTSQIQHESMKNSIASPPENLKAEKTV